ncbi:HD domain-containing protein [Desulfosporosinus sp. OT]|uniref:HD domain-containing protein n=1 Tax=Desulfosporosinus sp. OT TaxID=913865 RepID=UPI000223AC5D|nr:HD domain-containing protein [Desulfosporosinus sp. OT]EGW38296.1 hypothetical protein DOT_3856 [Desulfosporosinus sp. OT]
MEKTFRKILESMSIHLYDSLNKIEQQVNKILDTHYTNNFLIHSKEVEKILDKLIPVKEKVAFTKEEIFILLSAIILHDVGLFIPSRYNSVNELREKHAEISADYVNSLSSECKIDTNILLPVAILCRAHSKPQSINNVDEFYQYNGIEIRLRFIGALLSLSDGMEIFSKRVILDRVPDDLSSRRWKSNALISSLSFDPSRWSISLETNTELPSEINSVNNLRDFLQQALTTYIPVLNRNGIYYSTIFVNNVAHRASILPLSSTGIEEVIKIVRSIDLFSNVSSDLDEYCKLHIENQHVGQVKLIKKIMQNVLKNIDKGELYNFYDSWIRFEVLFNMFEIRDHFIHNFETFLLGCYFLESIRTNTPVSLFLNYSYNELIFSWILASTFHDIGYPIEHYSDVRRLITDLYDEFGLYTIAKEIDNVNINKQTLQELYVIHLTINAKFGEEKRINIRVILLNQIMNQLGVDIRHAELILCKLEQNFQHGLVSSCLLIKKILNAKGIDYFSSSYFKLLMAATIAILLHHFDPSDGVPIQINLYSLPIVTLLLICDEIQEWNRPLDDLGLDSFRGRITYKLETITTIVEDNSLIFKVVLFVLDEAGLDEKTVNEKVARMLVTKKDRFNIISQFSDSKARKNISILLKVYFKGNQVYEDVRKLLILKEA